MSDAEELIDLRDLNYRCPECKESFGDDIFDRPGNEILLVCWDCDVFIVKKIEADLKNRINF